MKKNFFNNWDFKAILTILIIIGQFIWSYATLKSEVSSIKSQRDADVETVKTVRSNDVENINKNLTEIKELLKEMRQDIKSKKDK